MFKIDRKMKPSSLLSRLVLIERVSKGYSNVGFEMGISLYPGYLWVFCGYFWILEGKKSFKSWSTLVDTTYMMSFGYLRFVLDFERARSKRTPAHGLQRLRVHR